MKGSRFYGDFPEVNLGDVVESLGPSLGPGTYETQKMETTSPPTDGDSLSGEGKTNSGRKEETTTYATALKKNYPCVVLDFVCASYPEEVLTDKIMADFVFDELRMQKSEMTGMRARSKGNRVVKVLTKESVSVEERFGENFHFARQYSGKTWHCKIRGGNKVASPLRLLCVPEDIGNEELINEVAKFSEVRSGIISEVFAERNDPRLRGLSNGHRRAYIIPKADIPDFISVGTKKIKIIHRDQVRTCYKCKNAGHIKVDCPNEVRTNVEMVQNENIAVNDEKKSQNQMETVQNEMIRQETSVCPEIEINDDETGTESEHTVVTDKCAEVFSKKKLPSTTTPRLKDVKISKKKKGNILDAGYQISPPKDKASEKTTVPLTRSRTGSHS